MNSEQRGIPDGLPATTLIERPGNEAKVVLLREEETA
jgi:hypothetical protein